MEVTDKNKKSSFEEYGMFNEASPKMFELAKSLRKNMTDAEKLLWNYLKNGINGLKFRRQHPIGIYIVDFYCHKVKLIIELDGSIHNIEEVRINDKVRESNLRSWGCTILRFTNEELYIDISKVLLTLKIKVEELLSEVDKSSKAGKSSQ